MHDYAWVTRKPPGPGKTGLLPPADHDFKTRAPRTPQGDPFNTRNIVHSGDFYHDGKPWADPGTNVNIYSSIPSIQAVANKFFGFVSKVRYIRQSGAPRTWGFRSLGADVNVEAPQPTTYGDFATFSSMYRERIRTSSRG